MGDMAATLSTLISDIDAEDLQRALLQSLEYRLADLPKRFRVIKERFGEVRRRFVFFAVGAAINLGGAPFVWGTSAFWICLVGGVLCLRLSVTSLAAWRGFADLLRRPELVDRVAF